MPNPSIQNQDADHNNSTNKEEGSTIESESKFQCPKCDKLFSHNRGVHAHIRSVHQCDYQATQQGSLTIHIQSLHEGVKYACNQCEYQATQHGHLTRHIQSKHS